MGSGRQDPWPDPIARIEADLALQAASILAAESDGQRAERVRAELAAVRLADRLRGAEGGRVRLLLLGGSSCEGLLAEAGSDHVCVDRDDGRRTLVRLDVVLAVCRLGRHHRAAGRLAWGLTGALRRLAADRTPVEITAVDGRRLLGTVRSVGADHFDLDEHLGAVPGAPGDERVAREAVTVALGAVATVTVGAGFLPDAAAW